MQWCVVKKKTPPQAGPQVDGSNFFPFTNRVVKVPGIFDPQPFLYVGIDAPVKGASFAARE